MSKNKPSFGYITENSEYFYCELSIITLNNLMLEKLGVCSMLTLSPFLSSPHLNYFCT